MRRRWEVSIETMDYTTLEKSNLQKDMGLSKEWKKNPVLLMSEAKNYIRKSAFVQCSIRESIQNQWTKPHSKTNTQSFINTQYKQPHIYNQKEQYQLQQYKEHQLKQKLRISIKNQYSEY